ncbi:MAG: glycosyltransferase family 4 protein [Hyphomicrobiaceae bacterium]
MFIPTLGAGGAERVASILANTWHSYPGVRVTVLLMFEDEIFYPVDPGVKLVGLGLQPNLTPLKKVRALTKALGSFRKAVLAEQPAFVLSFMNKYNVFCLAALTGSGVPVIVSERDSPTEPGRRLNWLLREWLYPRAKGIITQSKLSEQHLIKRRCHTNIAVISNPVDNLTPQSTEPREKIVLNVARLVPKKGHSDLLEAFARADVGDWRLVLCGDGPLRPELEKQAKTIGIGDRVLFEGTVKNVWRWYARASVFAFTSYFEGFPNALAEAMSAGVAPVSYDCPTGPAELIEDGKNGYLVPVGNVDEFAQRLKALTADPELTRQISERATAVADRLEVSVVAKEYFDFCVRSAALEGTSR